jgi:N4-gp56 family major capsid protein
MKKFLLSIFTRGVTNYSPGATNQTIANDIELLIAKKTLRIAQRKIVISQFGEKLTIPKNQGVIYTATRYERLPLPFAPLSEGVAAAGQAVTIAQVNATAQQWGDLVRVTDVADMTIAHPLFKKATDLLAIQQVETIERNAFATLMTGSQVNYANGRANRAALVATDVLTPLEYAKILGSLTTFGAPMFDGSEGTDIFETAGATHKPKNPSSMAHYIAVMHNLVEQDMRQNSTIATAWAYSDVDRLYNSDLGYWGGMRSCTSNMVPYWTGVATVGAGAPSATGGSLANGTYYLQVTAAPTLTSVEQQIYQVATVTTVGGSGAGSISLTLPTLAGYVFNVYIGTTTAPVNLATSASGPATGPLAGQATQLASGSTVILTGVGVSQTPPAAPATGVTVFPTFFFGKDAYGTCMLDNIKYTYLTMPDKYDPMNQTKVATWKTMYGNIILNNAYMARAESSSAFSVGYSAGTATE